MNFEFETLLYFIIALNASSNQKIRVCQKCFGGSEAHFPQREVTETQNFPDIRYWLTSLLATTADVDTQ